MKKIIKSGVKILALACSSFDRTQDKEVILTGVVYRGSTILEGVIQINVTVDGEDATDKIIQMVSQSSHKKQLNLIMTRGVTIAGLNYIDIKRLNEITSLPVISVVDHKPNLEKISIALKNVPNWERRFEIIAKSAALREVKTSINDEPIFVQSIGIAENSVDNFLKEITIIGRIPEPIRIARLIATAENYD